MVRAILEGKKTQTRRYVATHTSAPYSVGDILYVQETFKVGAWRTEFPKIAIDYIASPELTNTPWLEPKTHRELVCFGVLLGQTEDDTSSFPIPFWEPGKCPTRIRSEGEMSEWLSRIKLRVTKKRIENLLDITEEDAVAEGFTSTQEEYSYGMSLISAAGNFQKYWYELYGDDPIKGLEANPRVFVYEFERIL